MNKITAKCNINIVEDSIYKIDIYLPIYFIKLFIARVL